MGERFVSFTSHVSENEFDCGLVGTDSEDDYSHDPEALAVELAIAKFFKEYTMHAGTVLEVVSVELL
jgi:hypothetical protein